MADLEIVDYCYAERQRDTVKVVHLDNQLELDEMMVRHPLPKIIMPGDRWLLGVKTLTEIPSGVAGLVELRSTLARAGFFGPATYADPRFEGYLTLELWNGNRWHAFEIHGGMKLFAVLQVLTNQEPDYQGRYQGQVGITTAKALRET